MTEMSRAELRTLCSYLALPSLAHHDEVLAETHAHIARTPAFDGKLEIVAASGRADLVETLEATHGPDIFAAIDITDAAVTNRLSRAQMPKAMRRRIFCAALRDRLNQGLRTPLPQMGAACDCPDFHYALIVEGRPDAHAIASMLINPRITESPAWRAQPDRVAQMIEAANFDHAHATQITLDAVSRGQVRALTILAKLGLAAPVPEMVASSYGNMRITGLCHELTSNHGRMALMQRLPSVADLLMPSGIQLERMIDRALLPAAGQAKPQNQPQPVQSR